MQTATATRTVITKRGTPISPIRITGHRRVTSSPSLPAPSSPTRASLKPSPSRNSSFEIFILLSRLLPTELVIPVLNLSEHYYRFGCFRRLETVTSARGQSIGERERRGKVYLEIPLKTQRRLKKVVWVVRMPASDVSKDEKNRVLKPSSIVRPLAVSLRRPAETHNFDVHGLPTKRDRCDFHRSVVSLRPVQSHTRRLSGILINSGYKEVSRVPLEIKVPPAPKSTHIVAWTDPETRLGVVEMGDKLQLILPAVYGYELSSDGFRRAEIWEAQVYLFSEW